VNNSTLLLSILVPLFAGVITLLVGSRGGVLKEVIALAATAFTFGLAVMCYNHEATFALPWAGFGMEFLLRLYHFSSFILLAAAGFATLVVLYCCSFMRGREKLNQFYGYLLITVAMVNGAVLADNLVLLLFFWESLLLTLFGMIAIGGKEAFKTATKAFIIVGISDLCMMIGIGITGYLAGTMTMSKIHLETTGIAGLGFILMMIGAISKAGSMPFHSWIPDAAVDAPLPFMAFLPASLEKLLGIYLLARIALDLYVTVAGSWVSITMMTIGSITILLAVMMALIQKDYKRLLSFHAISQVGYMVLGIGTCVPVGIVGGLFHMINHALYKSCLFLTGGSVEKQAGTTDLAKLGGLWRKMPVTCLCFIAAACAISGVWPFNGFFSKEMVYDGALSQGWVFYAAAVLGTFFTAASFLKLGHAVYFGARHAEHENVKEANWKMLVPMILIALICLAFGQPYHVAAVDELIKPIVGEARLAGHEFGASNMLIAITVIVLIVAVIHHLYAAASMGGGLHASDHIRHAPGLEGAYNRAEKRQFDPYNIAMTAINGLAAAAWRVDRSVDWLYDGLSVRATSLLSGGIRSVHSGNLSWYVVWSLLGVVFVVVFLMKWS
jgi:formate hydrogenlyase subunit 3/multisubunit Na+/H+ antiporter MnhD subunit